MNRMRSIDPPTLPAWAEEMTDSGKKKMTTTEDPAALAKRLAAEAKAKLAKANEPPAEDPAAMAKRLAAEAKAKLAEKKKAEAAKPAKKKKSSLADRAINPKALAKKLAAEKKADLESKRKQNLAKLKAKEDEDAVSTLDLPGPAEPVDEAPAEIVPPAPAKAKKKAKKKPAAPKKKKSLRERATQKKSLSAAEALAAAMAAESSPPAKPKVAPQKEKPAKAEATPVQAPSAPAVQANPAALADLIPGAEIASQTPVSNVAVFSALWKAHRAQAAHNGDLALMATASTLLEAIDHVPAGQLVAARVSLNGREWAVWADLDRGRLLGAAAPPDVFLAGL